MFVNILQLTFSIYMLQVYDKVLTSYNLSTLAVITLAAVICLVVLALLEWIRSRLLVRAGIAFDNMLSATVLSMNLKHAAAVPGGALQIAKSSNLKTNLQEFFLLLKKSVGKQPTNNVHPAILQSASMPQRLVAC